jgi:hypothetical protein
MTTRVVPEILQHEAVLREALVEGFEHCVSTRAGDHAYEVPYFGVGSQSGGFLRVESLNNFNGRVPSAKSRMLAFAGDKVARNDVRVRKR